MRTPFSRLTYLPLFGILTLASGCQPGAVPSNEPAAAPAASAAVDDSTRSIGVKQESGPLDQAVQRTAATVEPDVKQAMPLDPPPSPTALPAVESVKSDLNRAATEINQTAEQTATQVESGVAQGVSELGQTIRDRAHRVTDSVIETGEDQLRQNVQRAEDQLKTQFGRPR